jgi:hypothetical protein
MVEITISSQQCKVSGIPSIVELKAKPSFTLPAFTFSTNVVIGQLTDGYPSMGIFTT